MPAKGLVIVIALSALSGPRDAARTVSVQGSHLLQDDAGTQTSTCWCPDQSCKDFFDRAYTLNGCFAACNGIARCNCGTCADGSPSVCSCDPN